MPEDYAEGEVPQPRKKSNEEVAVELEQRYPETAPAYPKEVPVGYPSLPPGSAADKEEKKPKEVRKIKSSAPSSRRLVQINCDEAGRTVKSIEDEPYYHGFMTRQDTEKILKKDGEFLVRKTDVGGRHHIVISLMESGELKHFLVKRTSKKRLYWVYDYAFKTVSDLVQYHLRNRAPLTATGTFLEKPCQKKEWQLNPEQIEPQVKIGEGAFGEVYKGLLQDGIWGARIPVAIKTLHSTNMTADDRIQFLQEASIMREFKHENVVRLHGVCTSKEPIMIVMELAAGGSLLSRLKNLQKPPSTEAKVNFVYGGARGMAYLQSKEIIHRDIAARNCLLGEKDEVKISDFGLSFIGKTLREKKLKKVPLRWLSPETLKRGVYNTKTDVYSFSIMIWEIFSFGQIPFYKYENHELRVLIKEKKATLPTCLSEIPDDMNELRLRCMHPDPDVRPDFHELESIIAQMPGIRKPQPPSFLSRISTAISDYIYGRVYT
nr:SH2 motif and Tyrosine protein kinase domain containing protein [Haemonchus contortus]